MGSSAVGTFQFMPGTFVENYRKAFPTSKETRAQILAKITNRDAQEAAMEWRTYDHEQALLAEHYDVTPTNIYLLHVLNPERAFRVMRNPDARIGDLLPGYVVKGNKWQSNWTGAQLVDWATERVNRPLPGESR